MIKRIFSLFFGLGLGLLVGGFVVRRVDQATRAVAPASIATRIGRGVGGLGVTMRHLREEAAKAAEAREAELRDRFDVPRVRDALGG